MLAKMNLENFGVFPEISQKDRKGRNTAQYAAKIRNVLQTAILSKKVRTYLHSPPWQQT